MHPLVAVLLLLPPAPLDPVTVPAAPTPTVPTPRIPTATIDDTLEVTGEAIAGRRVRTRMTVGVTLNGAGPFRFLVDSGADRSAVGAALAVRLALPPAAPVTLQSIAGASRVATVRLDRLRVGVSEIADAVLPTLPEAFLGAQGLLGIDALAGQRLSMDFDRDTITVEDTRRPLSRSRLERDDGEVIVVTARRRKGQLILTEAYAGGTRISAVIDTGAEITIGNMALHSAIFGGRRKPPPVIPTTLISVTGAERPADLIVLPELRIGNLTLQRVTLAFADVPPFRLFGLADTPAILLGTDVLEVFRRVSLDFRNRKIRFLLRG